MDIEELNRNLTDCCNIAANAVESYSSEGQGLITQFLPGARTVVILGHHIQASLEWVWFPFAIERGGYTCAADLHAKMQIESIERQLKLSGHNSLILPYPNSCGISFKRLAARTSMGEMGESFLFLHHKWGPWVHLRVLLTDAPVADRQIEIKTVCTHCGKCIQSCPGKTLTADHHDQKACGQYQQAVHDRLMIKAKYRYKCEICARVCPVAEAPLELTIKDEKESDSTESPENPAPDELRRSTERDK